MKKKYISMIILLILVFVLYKSINMNQSREDNEATAKVDTANPSIEPNQITPDSQFPDIMIDFKKQTNADYFIPENIINLT